MTVADVIRGMDDIQLAEFLHLIIHERDLIMSEKLAAQGVPNDLISLPAVSIAQQLQLLREPAGTIFNLEEGDDE